MFKYIYIHIHKHVNMQSIYLCNLYMCRVMHMVNMAEYIYIYTYVHSYVYMCVCAGYTFANLIIVMLYIHTTYFLRTYGTAYV